MYIESPVKLRKVIPMNFSLMRTISFIFLFFFLVSCGRGNHGSEGSLKDSFSESNLVSIGVPIEAQTFDIQAKFHNMDQAQEDKIYRAFELIKKVIASDEFKFMILNKKWNGTKQFVDNNGLTNVQIYQKILEGAELLNRNKNNRMDLSLKTYFDNSTVIGYTKPEIQTIYLNTKYLDRENFTPDQVAMNLTHEWLHKLGFSHAITKTPSRDDSVPYAIGYIMRNLAKELN
jgi:hypothetical protein